MSLSRRHFAALLLATTLACVESPMEPGRTYLLPAIEPKLVMPPGLTPASFGIVIDSVTILIEQRDSGNCDCTPVIDTVFVDSTFAWPATQESFQLRVVVPPPPPDRVVAVYLSYSSGGVMMFQGNANVDFRRGDIRLPPIPMYFFGPGNGADDIQMAPGDTAMAIGDTLQFIATAYNNGLPVDTAYLSWRVSDPTVAQIDHLGQLTLRAGALGSSFLVTAAIPSGAMSSTRVSVPNPVTALVKVAGDSQSAALGERTAAPIVVRARDVNNKPVAGARIRFRFLGGAGAALPDSIVFTDPLGLARSAPIPTTAGVSTLQAEVSAAPATNIGFAVTGTAPLGRPILFAGDSGGSGYQLYRADSLGGNRFFIGYLAGTSIAQTSPRWNPARNRVAYIVYNANAGINDLLLTTAIGDTVATLVSDSNSTGPRFSPTGKMIAWVCRGLVTDLTLGSVCTFNGADAALGTLNGAADGAGRVEVTATVPSRPNGPPAFAWRPGGSTRIAFVRDTVLDTLSGVVASRIYDVNGAGGTATPLSPRVADLGQGPLRIEGTIDWSPDGTTIVFSAADTTSYEAALYALDVSSGTVRRLTTPPLGWTGDLHPTFSPDGQRILYRRVYYYYCCGMIQDYYVVRLVGGGPTRISYDVGNWGSANLDPYYLGGDWSPNGGSVVITAPNGLGGKAAYRVPIDVTSQADYNARRLLVGTAGIAGLTDYGVSWGP